eukprot:TRINITY_DN6684_c0_g1_i2.p1 TRINITY_DN6684_c0_g1~~TRINITY_DN6684_c0_g1_i2.p1  ORF type:complete len:585 (+),score=93.35 TRINITY_DN6684_c0_g1_i2:27-1757(+)
MEADRSHRTSLASVPGRVTTRVSTFSAKASNSFLSAALRPQDSFIQAKDLDDEQLLDPWAKKQKRIRLFMASPLVDVLLMSVVTLDTFMMCVDVDARSARVDAPAWATTISHLCFVMYVVELFVQTLANGVQLLKDSWAIVDILIVMSSSLELALTAAGLEVSLALLRTLRLIRVLRILKLLRRFTIFNELRRLLLMMSSSIRTLLWSTLITFLLLTIWALISAEVVQPVIERIEARGGFKECLWCKSSMSSVFNAILTLVRTMVAGDSWGAIAVPVINEEPWTALIFIGALVTLVFGVLNMAIAVVVDTFADQRAKDVLGMAEELDHESSKDRKNLKILFDTLDKDSDGLLTLPELMHAAQTLPEFRSRLRVMDIDAGDLEQLFNMLDSDQSGSISPNEFISALSRWLVESKTAARFVKYNVQRTMMEQMAMRSMLERQVEMHEKLSTHLEEIEKDMHKSVLSTNLDNAKLGQPEVSLSGACQPMPACQPKPTGMELSMGQASQNTLAFQTEVVANEYLWSSSPRFRVAPSDRNNIPKQPLPGDHDPPIREGSTTSLSAYLPKEAINGKCDNFDT